MEEKCAIHNISEINNAACKYITKRIKEENLSILQNHVPIFFILPKDGSSLIFNEIAKIWNISKSSLSDIINKYEKQGLLIKNVCMDDKRSICISLTEEAILVREKLENIEAEILEIMLKDFDDNKKHDFEKNITQCLNNIRKML